MKSYIEKTAEKKQHSEVSSSAQTQPQHAMAQFEDRRPTTIAQRKLQEDANQYVHQQIAVQRKANQTGLPDQLKNGIENLSGLAMDDVKVHYNSAQPTQLQAHAYAQGNHIHIAPGQEKHLPHEAWHVVQQKQGRVKPTLQLKGKVNVNHEVALEREADIMDAQSLSPGSALASQLKVQTAAYAQVIQRQFTDFDLENPANLADYKTKSAQLSKAKQKVFDKLLHDPVINISIEEAFEAAKNIIFTSELDRSYVPEKPKLSAKNINLLKGIADPAQFIGPYAILSGQNDLNWPKAYKEATDELQLYDAVLAEDQKQLLIDKKNLGLEDPETIQNEREIEIAGQQLADIGRELEANHLLARTHTIALLEKTKTNSLGGAIFNEGEIRIATTRINALVTRLKGLESRSHSAKARAHDVGGEVVDNDGSDAIYAGIQIGGHAIANKFQPVDVSLKPPDTKSVINLEHKSEKTATVHDIDPEVEAREKERIKRLAQDLAPAQSKIGVTYRAPARYADRGPGQANSMGGINAATYAWALDLPHALTTDWEWLHIQGAGLGGATNSTNLLPGLYDANTLMIPFESNIKILARHASNFMPLSVDFIVLGPRAGQHAAQSIQIKWQFNHVRLTQGGSATFDILNGRVVTKGDIEVIEDFLKTERAPLIEPEDADKKVRHFDHEEASAGLAIASSSKKARVAAAADEELVGAHEDQMVGLKNIDEN